MPSEPRYCAVTMRSLRHGDWVASWIFRVTLFCAAISLLFNVVGLWRSANYIRNSVDSVQLAASDGFRPTFKVLTGQSPIGSVLLTMLIDRVDVQRRTIDILVWIEIPKEEIASVIDSQTNRSILTWRYEESAAQDKFASAVLKLDISTVLARTPASSTQVISIPLGSLRGNADDTLASGVTLITLPIIGTPSRFPLDEYGVDMMATIAPPDGISWRSRGGQSLPSGLLPLQIRFAITPSCEMAGAATRKVGGFALMYVELQLRRALRNRLSVTAVIASLLALLLLITTQLWRAALTIGERWSVVTGLAAIALAALPLRSILVPSDLPSLTIVDGILGVYLCGIIGLVGRVLRTSEPPANSR